MDEELVDVYDENNKSLGVIKPRSIAHRDGLWHRTAHIYVINDQGQYLVHLRSPYKDLHPNCWATCIGGHVVAGMDYDRTAIEELHQEVGLKIDLKDLISSEIHKSDNGTNREYKKIYFYKYNGELIDLEFNDNEVMEVKWMYPDEIVKSIEQNPQIWASTVNNFQNINTIKNTLGTIRSHSNYIPLAS